MQNATEYTPHTYTKSQMQFYVSVAKQYKPARINLGRASVKAQLLGFGRFEMLTTNFLH